VLNSVSQNNNILLRFGCAIASILDNTRRDNMRNKKNNVVFVIS